MPLRYSATGVFAVITGLKNIAGGSAASPKSKSTTAWPEASVVTGTDVKSLLPPLLEGCVHLQCADAVAERRCAGTSFRLEETAHVACKLEVHDIARDAEVNHTQRRRAGGDGRRGTDVQQERRLVGAFRVGPVLRRPRHVVRRPRPNPARDRLRSSTRWSAFRQRPPRPSRRLRAS